MNKKDQKFLRELLATFKVEAGEHINAISSGLIELEKTTAAENRDKIIDVIYREVHSLKGAARAVDLRDIEVICQSLENVFSAMKKKDIEPSARLFDTLHRSIDTITQLLTPRKDDQKVLDEKRVNELREELARLEAGKPVTEIPGEEDISKPPKKMAPPALKDKKPSVKKLEKPEEKPPVAAAPEVDIPKERLRPISEDTPALAETVRITTAKLDSLLLQAEEMLSVKLSMGQHLSDLGVVMNDIEQWKKEWTKFSGDTRTDQHSQKEGDRRNGQKLIKRKFDKLLEFLDWNHQHIKTLEGKLTELTKSTEHDHRFFGGMVENLLDDMKLLLMLPFTSLLEIMPKLVRDLSRDQGKQAELEIQGSEIEIDKRILEEMKDPLIHLIRNCIDHGIEKPEERKRLGKTSRGKVTVTISRVNSNKVEILVTDDGAGIDPGKLRDAAVNRGMLSMEEAEKLTEEQALALVFLPEFSTSPIITEISGRGLGLTIVKEKVDKLGGLINFDSQVDVGSSFRVILPLTLASFRGIQVEVGDQIFVVPTVNVERVLRMRKEEIKTVENLETIPLNARTVSLVRLHDVLALPQRAQPGRNSDLITVMVLCAGEKRIAFVIDEVLNELEVLVKGLGRQLTRVPNIAGATVLGSGQVVPILNVTDLMKSAVKVTTAPVRPVVEKAEAVEEEKEEKNSILLVEDSITSRTLLRNILESAGYRVKTTVDGADGFTALKTEHFDLVVSDIQMPRMDGFELTSKIRADKQLTDMPVVLVTGLDTREDKERGIDAGANAYIVKSTFDKSNLLEVIEKLI